MVEQPPRTLGVETHASAARCHLLSSRKESLDSMGDSVVYDNDIVVSKEVYALPEHHDLPNECSDAIFVPGFAKNAKHYYFLVDFRTKAVHCWQVDLEKLVRRLSSELSFDLAEELLPWNHQDIRSYVENIYYPHSAEYYNGWIYVSYYFGNVILGLSIASDSYEVITDELHGLGKIYSSTNTIASGEIYFTRWDIDQTFRREKDRRRPVVLELGKYSIEDRRFEVVDTIEGADEIHSTCRTPDGENVLIVCMSQAPRKRFPRRMDEASNAELQEVLRCGLHDSYITTYHLASRTYHTITMHASPAHIEFDRVDPQTYYVVGNNLSFNGNSVMCHGNARIDKLRIVDRKSILVDTYSADDFYRGTAHKLTTFDGKELMACTVYPNQVHLFDTQRMEPYKKLFVYETRKKVDFSNGPHEFPKPAFDRTPYGVHPIDNSPYFYATSVWNIVVYDFSEQKKISVIMYNIDKPIIGIGHTSRFMLDV
jgi:hypothetical protein